MHKPDSEDTLENAVIELIASKLDWKKCYLEPSNPNELAQADKLMRLPRAAGRRSWASTAGLVG